MLVLCVDFGSTFTKAVVVDTGSATVVGGASAPTTAATDVLDGYREIRDRLDQVGVLPTRHGAEVLACSSAGGGLRLAVVGYERSVTAEAGHRVGLSAGARVIQVNAGPMGAEDVAALRAARPDVVLLVGGTDGGNSEVLLHNAARLSRARLAAPVVVAGNALAADAVAAELSRTGRRFVLSPNVLPRIGVVAPDGARAAIREVFLRHVIGGKGLSKGPAFARMVRAATPDAMLSGVEALAAGGSGDVLVVDVGGATTDVYSAVDPQGEDAALPKEVVAPLWRARTVEGDLGVRWNAPGVVAAAVLEGLLADDEVARLEPYAERVSRLPAYLPDGPSERRLDLELTRLAAVVAVRRHARPSTPGGQPRPLQDVVHVVGSGGVLRHADPAAAAEVLETVTSDHAGGWKLPRAAGRSIDSAYVLFAAGLLSETDPEVASAVAHSAVGSSPALRGRG